MRRIALATTVLLFAARGEAADPPPSLPAPPLVLSVSPGTGGGPWKMKIENTGDVPVRIAADARLLTFELAPPSAADANANKKPPKPLRCALPDDARPATDEGKELVVPGKRSWTMTIDPLYYCFGTKERAALVAGASMTARFGWTPAKKGKDAAPFAAVPVGAAVDKVAPVKQLEAAPITLAEGVAPPAAAAKDAAEPPVTLTLPESLDVARGTEVSATTTLANDGDRPLTTLFRPATLGFHVSGPQGSVSCGAQHVSVASPIRELFTTIGPKGKAQLTVMLAAVCPPDTFDEPGVYRVVPRLDTSAASGRPLGLKTLDAEIEGRTPMLLRVRSPRRDSATPRPKLDG
jgi:hypothetical protein